MMHLHGVTASDRTTGWVDMSHLLGPAWVLGGAVGSVRLCRTGDMVDAEFRIQRSTDPANNQAILAPLPEGWRAVSYVAAGLLVSTVGSPQFLVGFNAALSTLQTYGVITSVSAGTAMAGNARWRTTDTWPV